MKTIPLLVLLLTGAPWARAADDAAIIEHLRESYNFPGEVGLSLSAPRKSAVAGFDERTLTLSLGEQSQTETLYVSKDGRHYILGGFKDLSVHPDLDRLRKMDLKDAAARGPAKAPVTVVEYTDFQCPYCQRGYQIMADRIMKDYDGKVRWVYKSLPLAMHPWAKPAAIAAECAGRQSPEKLWRMHDDFFIRQGEINNGNYEKKIQELAKAAKLDMKRFNACYDKSETLKTVERDMEEARVLGINGTPAFVVNGHLVSGADYMTLKRVVDESLQGKHGRP